MVILTGHDVIEKKEFFRYESLDGYRDSPRIGDIDDLDIKSNLANIFNDIDTRANIELEEDDDEDPRMLVKYSCPGECDLVAGDFRSYTGEGKRVGIWKIKKELDNSFSEVRNYDDPRCMAELEIVNLDDDRTVLWFHVGGAILFEVTNFELPAVKRILSQLDLIKDMVM